MAEEKYSPLWDEVSVDNNLTTLRMRVVGGWLVHVRDSTTGDANTITVADPNHDWTPSTQIDPD
jgi:hypothetical protein